MMKVCYSEMDGPEGMGCRLEACGHAGYAPAGQDIVCAGASTLMQALVYLLAGEPHPGGRLGGAGGPPAGCDRPGPLPVLGPGSL